MVVEFNFVPINNFFVGGTAPGRRRFGETCNILIRFLTLISFGLFSLDFLIEKLVIDFITIFINVIFVAICIHTFHKGAKEGKGEQERGQIGQTSVVTLGQLHFALFLMHINFCLKN